MLTKVFLSATLAAAFMGSTLLALPANAHDGMPRAYQANKVAGALTDGPRLGPASPLGNPGDSGAEPPRPRPKPGHPEGGDDD